MNRDEQIQRAVLDALHADGRVRPTDIGVEVHRGIVTLTGAVDAAAARLAAQEAAHRVSAVLDVVNALEVRAPGHALSEDCLLAAAVRSVLEWDVAIPDERISTTVSKGVVTLDGTVDDWRQREDAARILRNLSGVRQVDNRIIVRPHAR